MPKKKLPPEQNSTAKLAQAVLDANFKEGYTVPSKSLYPHQWLWDSCFHAIGLRHAQPRRALEELQLLLRGQWQNGMVPHILFSGSKQGAHRYNIWKSHVCDDCIVGLRTSALTQPPVIAWAFEKVIEKLPKKEQPDAIKKYLPQLIRYHQWLYKERDPDQSGRVVIFHPWESGLDDNPALMNVLERCFPINGLEDFFLKSGLFKFIYQRFRRDFSATSAKERSTNKENWMFGRLIVRYRQKLYDPEALLHSKKSFVVESVAFNSILVRSNASLVSLAKKAKHKLPSELKSSMARSELALSDFYDEGSGNFYDREWQTNGKIKIPTVSNLLPLVSPGLSKKHAKIIVEQLSRDDYSTIWPVPSLPLSSPEFDPIRYWQGPTWININWMLIEGLTTHGYKKEAATLRTKTQQLIEQFGIWEYYNPQTGQGHGVYDFSWTAALYLDLINSK